MAVTVLSSPDRRRRSFLLFVLVFSFVLGGGLAAQDPDALEALLVVPREVQIGGQASATVTVLDGLSRQAANVPLALFLVRDGERIEELATGETGADGHVTLMFDMPEVAGGSYLIEAEVAGVTDPLLAETSANSTPAILIETDKAIYKPSQTIQGRIVLLDNALRPRAGAVELNILDAKGIRIDRQQVTASRPSSSRLRVR